MLLCEANRFDHAIGRFVQDHAPVASFSDSVRGASEDDNSRSSVDGFLRPDLGAGFKRNKQPIGQRRKARDQIHRDPAKEHRQTRSFAAGSQEEACHEYDC